MVRVRLPWRPATWHGPANKNVRPTETLEQALSIRQPYVEATFGRHQAR
jgi:hypothetical protein